LLVRAEATGVRHVGRGPSAERSRVQRSSGMAGQHTVVLAVWRVGVNGRGLELGSE